MRYSVLMRRFIFSSTFAALILLIAALAFGQAAVQDQEREDSEPGSLGTVTAGSSDGLLRFGWASDLGSNSNHTQDYLLGTRFEVPTRMQLSALGIITRDAGHNFRLALYRDAGDAPGDLLIETGVQSSTGARQEVAITPTYIDAGYYWLMGIFESDTSISYTTNSSYRVVYITHDFAVPPPEHFPKEYQEFTGQEFSYYVVGTE